MVVPRRCRKAPVAAGQRFERPDLLAKVIDWSELRRLRLQPDHQFGCLDAGKARNVVDRLFGIERRALAADIVEHVDDMAIQPHHAAFEDGEKPHRPCAYDDDVSLVRMPCIHADKMT